MALTKEQLFVEATDLIKSMPPRATIRHETEDNFAWFGRLAALVEAWNPEKAAQVQHALELLHDRMAKEAGMGARQVQTLVHQAWHDLRMQTSGPLSIAVDKGGVFQYFDELRKIFELATEDVLVVDPYANADFVSKYLSSISAGVTIRILARHKISALVPAAATFSKEYNQNIQVRSVSSIHDRYVFIDKKSCYQSGATFHDGAKAAPTTLTQITDAFDAILTTYESLWSSAKNEL